MFVCGPQAPPNEFGRDRADCNPQGGDEDGGNRHYRGCELMSTRSCGRRIHVAASDHGRSEFNSGKARAMRRLCIGCERRRPFELAWRPIGRCQTGGSGSRNKRYNTNARSTSESSCGHALIQRFPAQPELLAFHGQRRHLKSISRKRRARPLFARPPPSPPRSRRPCAASRQKAKTDNVAPCGLRPPRRAASPGIVC
jgi:hypothetical protein